MSYPSFNRLAGVVTTATGAAVIAFNAVLLPRLIPTNWEYPGYLILNSLLVFALTALYIRHLQHSSILLHLGYLLSAAGLILSIGFSFYAVFAFPTLRAQFPDAVGAVLSGPMNAALMASLIVGVIGNLLFYVALAAGIVTIPGRCTTGRTPRRRVPSRAPARGSRGPSGRGPGRRGAGA